MQEGVVFPRWTAATPHPPSPPTQYAIPSARNQSMHSSQKRHIIPGQFTAIRTVPGPQSGSPQRSQHSVDSAAIACTASGA
uniref:Uncharacterized protein n=1 Tax=Mycena chlorophos TaxID=658473 RepID=A0ABQ0LNI5_MYCCL|nr:predicted protein [Mycena chlorophos]